MSSKTKIIIGISAAVVVAGAVVVYFVVQNKTADAKNQSFYIPTL